MAHRWWIVAALGASITSAAGAQVCLGHVSFASGPVALAARASFTSTSRAFGATATLGQSLGVFASAGATRSIFSDGDGSLTSVDAGLAYEIALTPARNATFCPIVSFLHASDPDYPFQNTTVELAENDLGYGLSLGGAVRVSRGYSVVPFFGFTHYSTHTKLSDGGESVTTKDTYGTLAIGAGLASRRASFTPSVSIPLGLAGAKTIVRLRAQVVIGRR